jgi:hypothetical protein
MPPEQANGDVAHLDRRADVFGLGAILCEILTAKPPWVGQCSEEVQRKAVSGDLADAHTRLDGCGAHPELIVLTKWRLSPRAIDRPKDAQAVADGLSAYLNGVTGQLLPDAAEHMPHGRKEASTSGIIRPFVLRLTTWSRDPVTVHVGLEAAFNFPFALPILLRGVGVVAVLPLPMT